MNFDKKLFAVLVLAVAGICSNVFAQQITKFAVVDTARVYQAFYKDSTTVRNYETKKKSYQAEIDRLTKEMQDTHNQRLAAQKAGNKELVASLTNKLTQEQNFLSEYTTTKQAELENLKRSMQNNDAFYKKLYGIIEKVAESEGYSMVLSLQQNQSILWYSSSVDITNKVIQELGLKVR